MDLARHLRNLLGTDEREPVPLRGFLAVLLTIDVAVVLLHLLYKVSDNLFGFLLHVRFDMVQDGSLGEQVQYLAAFGVAVLCGTLFLRTWQPAYGAWSLAFLYLLADDALRLHEEFSKILGDSWRLEGRFGLGAQDLGELIVVAASASAILTLVALAHWYSDDDTRAFSRLLLLALAALGFFGAVIDLVPLPEMGRLVDSLIPVVEDGGELVVMSIALWLARWQDLALAE